jgi:hypothetical protein
MACLLLELDSYRLNGMLVEEWNDWLNRPEPISVLPTSSSRCGVTMGSIDEGSMVILATVQDREYPQALVNHRSLLLRNHLFPPTDSAQVSLPLKSIQGSDSITHFAQSLTLLHHQLKSSTSTLLVNHFPGVRQPH